MYYPTWVDIAMFTGTICLFFFLFLLFLRFLPAVSASEVKELRHEYEHLGHKKHGGAHAAGGAP
jgi:Ni/Fe-hydrogenase subunit HybB-like protein